MAVGNSQRVAFSPKEFSALFGKEQTWGYRQIYAGKVKTVTEYGRIMIPATEVERILGKADKYNGRKSRPAKQRQALDPWKAFIAAKRKKGKAVTPAERKETVRHASEARKAALARLAKRR